MSKIETVRKDKSNSSMMKSPRNSANFDVDTIEIDEEQITFIKNSLINHFIFKDMSNEIM